MLNLTYQRCVTRFEKCAVGEIEVIHINDRKKSFSVTRAITEIRPFS